MEIEWLGHASFLIKTSIGKRILTDPFDGDIGYDPYKSDVDVVTVSHNHFDHSNTGHFLKNTKVIDTIGKYNLNLCAIIGLKSYHDKDKGSKRGDNIIFIIEVDGFRICHLGDLGHILSKEMIEELGQIDLLLIPVGGHYTLDGIEAAKVSRSINPSYIIPMHYKTPALSFLLDGPEKFLTSMQNVNKLNSNCFILNEKTSSINKVILLSPPKKVT
ncbi:MBL fold metallo-hydrolase [Clostridium polyendosporum]|uniref:MBL fold metallo-hydrolase n=1 Tax=Clostridium polyendosporum TaxID=69208 RepID=A0A919VHA0_9CLOT|nr:MBL fold metallo-hydrolase [Clostridium polyendosporum]GIM30032.1 MBL fold metallo-hydrolase [Clostridium polyendosporum]